jgi:hypothetical protein
MVINGKNLSGDRGGPRHSHSLGFLTFLLILLLSGCAAYIRMQEQRAKVYDGLKALCDSLPIPEGLEKKGSQDITKPEGGVFTNNFETDLSCDNATRPLYEYLIGQGWQPTKQHLGYYFRDNYLFHATCVPLMRGSDRKRVQTSCSWDQSGTDKDWY